MLRPEKLTKTYSQNEGTVTILMPDIIQNIWARKTKLFSLSLILLLQVVSCCSIIQF